MNHIETAESLAGLNMTVTAPITHLCPFKDEVDNGTVVVTWTTRTHTIELHSLRAYFGSFAERTISHEELTDWVRNELRRIPGITAGEVRTSWTTAGMDVECFT